MSDPEMKKPVGKPGRKTSPIYAELNFTPLTDGVKWQAICNICGNTLSNVAAQRLKSHRYENSKYTSDKECLQHVNCLGIVLCVCTVYYFLILMYKSNFCRNRCKDKPKKSQPKENPNWARSRSDLYCGTNQTQTTQDTSAVATSVVLIPSTSSNTSPETINPSTVIVSPNDDNFRILQVSSCNFLTTLQTINYA